MVQVSVVYQPGTDCDSSTAVVDFMPGMLVCALVVDVNGVNASDP